MSVQSKRAESAVAGAAEPFWDGSGGGVMRFEPAMAGSSRRCGGRLG